MCGFNVWRGEPVRVPRYKLKKLLKCCSLAHHKLLSNSNPSTPPHLQAFPPQLDCDSPSDNTNTTNSSIYNIPTCTPCSRLNGFYMSENGFVNISDYLGIESEKDPSQACAAGYQCVSKDPFDAIPESESEIFSKAGKIHNIDLQHHSFPPSNPSPHPKAAAVKNA